MTVLILGGTDDDHAVHVWQHLRARGADMDWDQAIAYTLTQTTRALNEPQSETQP